MISAHELAMAVVNDRATKAVRKEAVRRMLNGATRDAAAHHLLPTVLAEMINPIYEGCEFENGAWGAALHVLDWELGHE